LLMYVFSGFSLMVLYLPTSFPLSQQELVIKKYEQFVFSTNTVFYTIPN